MVASLRLPLRSGAGWAAPACGGSREARETASIPSAGSLGGKVHCSHFLRGEPAGEPLEQSPPGSKPESCRDQAGQSQNRASKAEN